MAELKQVFTIQLQISQEENYLRLQFKKLENFCFQNDIAHDIQYDGKSSDEYQYMRIKEVSIFVKEEKFDLIPEIEKIFLEIIKK